MASSLGDEHGKVAKLLISSLEKIIKNASWRKHHKLVQDCKQVIEWFSKNPNAAVDFNPTNFPGVPFVQPTQGENQQQGVDSNGSAHEANGAREPKSPSIPVLRGSLANAPFVFEDGNLAYRNVDAEFFLQPIHLACETLAAKVVEPALDCLQKLISHGHLRGQMDPDSEHNTNLTAIIDSVCKCYDVADEVAELLVLKVMLSIVTSTTVRAHGECLLKALRTCYNIFLGSKVPVNQTTAKASLTQMLVVVFKRMEADSSAVTVAPIVVAELMEPAERMATDQNVTQFVQGFITRVVQDIEVVLTPLPAVKPLKHDSAFDTKPDLGSSSEGAEDKEMLESKFWDVNAYKGAIADAHEMKEAAGGGKVPSVEVRKAGQQNELNLPDVDPEKDNDLEAQITNKLRRDAFLVFRALCKLSMKNPPQEGVVDPFAVRGKIVALELLKICLENSGPTFRSSERFLAAIKQYLCLSLLKNCTSSLMSVFQLSCSIFFSLISKFRSGLKTEIGVFFPMIVLRVLENVAHANFQQKMIVLRFLERLCVDPQILVDIFVNYDCDVDATVSIFERMVNGLLKTAQGIPPGSDSTLNVAQDAQLRLAAIKCMVSVLRSMGHWTYKQLELNPPDLISFAPSKQSDADEAALNLADGGAAGGLGVAGGLSIVIEDGAGDEGSVGGSGGGGGGGGGSGMEMAVATPAAAGGGDRSEAAMLQQRRAYKLEMQEGITLFNKKPKKGLDFLMKQKKIGETPEDIVKFLKETVGLDKNIIGDFLGERDDLAIKVMHVYMDSFNLTGISFDEAIRKVLMGFRLPGEAQKIDRIMEKFAERYCRCNPKEFTSADTAYVLAYSVIMLNTDAHNPMVKTKMSKADFLRNNRGIDDGKDLPEEFLGSLYDRITQNEIKLKPDPLMSGNKAAAQRANSAVLGLENILNLIAGRTRANTELETSDEVVKHMQEQFKSKAGKSGSTFYAASDVQIIRPMVDVVWAPMLAAFSVPLGNSAPPPPSSAFEAAPPHDEEAVTAQCLDGFRGAIHVTAVMSLQTQRDAFMTSLAKFTSLHSPVDIKQKNIDAIKAILAIADEDGNFLQEAWEHVLTCVSRIEHLHLIGEGAPTDAHFFAEQQAGSEELSGAGGQKGKGGVGAAATPRKKHSSKHQVELIARRGSYESSSSGSGNFGLHITTEQMHNLAVNLGLLEQVNSVELSKIFSRSERLNGDAIVDFVKGLCKVSLEELRSPTEPRVFSMTKIVEIAHFNMNRIRLVWSRIWAVLADYFVTVGCMDNLSVAMYAIDSLRQLAMKFLEREELSNYNFQNEFLKPFVVVMRRSESVEIRELVIRCVSQMVFTRVGNVKSGWKIMFMVFTTAATDDHKNIVLLAFETIEKVVREYFPYITETETTTFTDCVNCLIAFTNSRFNADVSLNAIAFLRFCALKLAEGELGAAGLEKEKGGVVSPRMMKGQPGQPEGLEFTDKDDHIYFWFPLLAGLSELTFDPRPDIRKSALEVLFDTLRFHGHMFSPALWERVFDSVLFPIFDYVRRASEPQQAWSQMARAASSGEKSIDSSKAAGAAGSLAFEQHSHHKGGHMAYAASPRGPKDGAIKKGEENGGVIRRPEPERVSAELEMDAWLYETCTLALQLVVDLFVKFYGKVSPLLGKILSLLTSFIRRPHQSLAAIGVAAFVRLMSNGGALFSAEKWDQILAALKESTKLTLPDMLSVVTSAEREEEEENKAEESRRAREGKRFVMTDDDDHMGGQDDGKEAEGEAPQSLAEAISDVRCKIAVQLLLVQAMTEVYAQHGSHLSDSHSLIILDSLYSVGTHAHSVNSDRILRSRLQDLRSATQMPDPPLLRLESESYHAYLAMLLKLPQEKPRLAREVDVELRLVILCEEVLTVYVGTSTGRLSLISEEGGNDALQAKLAIPLGSARRRELVSRAPLVVATLTAVTGLKEAAFKKHLGRFFPLLVELVSCEHGSGDVQVALSKMFETKIGPILLGVSPK